MKLLLYTQRVEIVSSYQERRDCADQKIPEFLSACGYIPIPVPNVKGIGRKMVEKLSPSGIVLTGGNSLCKYGGDAPERDEAERELMEEALERKLPVYGFCRGMQMILDFFGSGLKTIPGHVAIHHDILGKWGGRSVNSFHNQGTKEAPDGFEIMAAGEDGTVEAIKSLDGCFMGTMWHPEREKPFLRSDLECVTNFFNQTDKNKN